MITHYCPACWQEIAGTEARCPNCGYDLLQDHALSFEEKLLSSLEHSVPERRYLAIQILGELGSQAALPGLEKLLDTEVKDIYALREALVALSKIPGPRSRALLQKASKHPFQTVRQLAERLLEMDQKACLFILVRHGQTAWNEGGSAASAERFRGRADVPLNEVGQAQAEATGRRVAAEWKPAAVYASPLARAVKTAEAVAGHFGLAVQVQEGLVDIDYGEWQGLTAAEVYQRWPEQAENWYHHPAQASIPGGETLDALRARAMQTIHALAAKHAGETIVLVGHTVINRVILLGIMGLGNERFWHIQQDTCAINVFEARQGDFVLVSLNDTCHLRQKLGPG